MNLEKRIEILEKRVAELEGRVQEQPQELNKSIEEIEDRFISFIKNIESARNYSSDGKIVISEALREDTTE